MSSGPDDLERARAAAQALHDAARALGESLRDGDAAALAGAFEERTRAFAALEPWLADGAPEALRETLAAVVALDREAVAAARQRMARVRAELEEIARAREVARRLAEQPGEARFVSRRV